MKSLALQRPRDAERRGEVIVVGVIEADIGMSGAVADVLQHGWVPFRTPGWNSPLANVVPETPNTELAPPAGAIPFPWPS